MDAGEIHTLLSVEELAAFELCSASNLRIEQERIPQSAVIEAVRSQ